MVTKEKGNSAMIEFIPAEVMREFRDSFELLYGERAGQCMERLRMLVGRYEVGDNPEPRGVFWNQADAVLITYADMVRAPEETPLCTLKRFADDKIKCALNTIHLLPFCPFSSDDGFSVIDYRQVHKGFGEWKDVEALGGNFKLMFDLVLNHASRKSDWFKDYVNGILPARKYFIETDPATDLSKVVRPRSLPLLTEVITRDGKRHVWTTFSSDQIDLDFSNPDVLFEFLDIILFYISKGVRIMRMDAIAYLWKEIGTACVHLPQTHAVVRILRDFLELVAPQVLLLSETNVPHAENISYFGQGDEANIVYQFSLPPLLLHALHNGTSKYLSEWARRLGQLPHGCTYLNFTASHDGVGVRPLEGIVPPEEKQALFDRVVELGGHISTKTNSDGTDSAYEMNITYFDALADSREEVTERHLARFLCSQTVALSLQGIPAVYFHSLTATRNDYDGVDRLGYPRAINRRKWEEAELHALLTDPASATARVFQKYIRLLRTRALHAAFHPDSSQAVLDLGDNVFALRRVSPDCRERIVAIHNLSDEPAELRGEEALHELSSGVWTDLILDTTYGEDFRALQLAPYQCVWLAQA